MYVQNGSQRMGWEGGWMYVRTDSLCFLQDFIPFGAAAQKSYFFAIFSYLGYLGALFESLKGPTGDSVCDFLFHILLLNIFQTKPAPKFFTNLLRNSKKKTK